MTQCSRPGRNSRPNRRRWSSVCAVRRAACSRSQVDRVRARRTRLEAVVAAYTASGYSGARLCRQRQRRGPARIALRPSSRSCGVPAQTVARLLLDLDDPRFGGLAQRHGDHRRRGIDARHPRSRPARHHAERAGGRDQACRRPAPTRCGRGRWRLRSPLHRCRRRARAVAREQPPDRPRRTPRRRRLPRRPHRRSASPATTTPATSCAVRTAGESYDAMVADWYASAPGWRARPDDRRAEQHPPRPQRPRPSIVLKAHGQLAGPALELGGREFSVGDEVVARRNDRTLRGQDTREFVKNGSVGIVTGVDEPAGAVEVEFRREGAIRLPRRYLAAGHLEHALRAHHLRQSRERRSTPPATTRPTVIVRGGLRRAHPRPQHDPALRRRRDDHSRRRHRARAARTRIPRPARRHRSDVHSTRQRNDPRHRRRRLRRHPRRGHDEPRGTRAPASTACNAPSLPRPLARVRRVQSLSISTTGNAHEAAFKELCHRNAVLKTRTGPRTCSCADPQSAKPSRTDTHGCSCTNRTRVLRQSFVARSKQGAPVYAPAHKQQTRRSALSAATSRRSGSQRARLWTHDRLRTEIAARYRLRRVQMSCSATAKPQFGASPDSRGVGIAQDLQVARFTITACPVIPATTFDL